MKMRKPEWVQYNNTVLLYMNVPQGVFLIYFLKLLFDALYKYLITHVKCMICGFKNHSECSFCS